MNKDTFNNLDIENQIEYINNRLSDNNSSITSVCSELGIGRSTIRDRFKKHGYEYNKELKQYVYNPLSEVAITVDNTDVVQCNTDTVNEVITITDTDIKNNILELANNYTDIMNMLEDYRRRTSVIKQQIILDIEEAESKLTTLRVNSKVLNDFNKFCDDNKQYRKIDLISQALKNFMEQHK